MDRDPMHSCLRVQPLTRIPCSSIAVLLRLLAVVEGSCGETEKGGFSAFPAGPGQSVDLLPGTWSHRVALGWALRTAVLRCIWEPE